MDILIIGLGVIRTTYGSVFKEGRSQRRTLHSGRK